jgi:hypothetical protein
MRPPARQTALTPAEIAAAAQMLAGTRPVIMALAGIAAPEALGQLCRDELAGVDLVTGGWDIRARWFGAVICATPRLGELDRAVTISWRVIAAQVSSPGDDPAALAGAVTDPPGSSPEGVGSPPGYQRPLRDGDALHERGTGPS